MWAGFLSGSLATVFKLEIADDKWSTINWTWYGVSFAVGVFGIVLLRMGKVSAAGQSEKSQSQLKQIKANLADLIINVEAFNKQISKMQPAEMIAYIDDELADDLREFADGRDSITTEHGLDVFAEVMTQFAAGERAINRAWCAAADGYVDEAATCVDRSVDFFRHAKDDLDLAAK